jgi:hypothetical protein
MKKTWRNRFEGPPPIVFPANGGQPFHADTGQPATPEEILRLSATPEEIVAQDKKLRQEKKPPAEGQGA